MRMPPYIAPPDASLRQRLDALTAFLHPDPDQRTKLYYSFEVLKDGNVLLLKEFPRSNAVLDERVEGIRVFAAGAGPGIYTSDGPVLATSTYAPGWRVMLVEYRAQMIITALTLPAEQSQSQSLHPQLRAAKLATIENQQLRQSAIEAALEHTPESILDFLTMLHELHRAKTHLVSGATEGVGSCSFLNL